MEIIKKGIKQKYNLLKNSIYLGLICCIICGFLHPFFSKAAEKDAEEEKKVVRIACGVNDTLYLDSNDNPAGCCAEYISAIAELNNWEIEYVEGNWNYCYTEFLKGNIDVIFPIQKTEEREKIMNFSSLSGGNQMVGLFASPDSGYCYNDFESFNGKKIAVTRNSSNEISLRNFAQKNNFTYESIYIDSYEEKLKALNTGEVDFAVFSTLNKQNDITMVAAVDVMPFYYAVSKENVELLDEINSGMDTMLVQQPELVKEVNDNTLGVIKNVAYTKQESEYIKSSDKVVVGLYKDTAPLVDTDKDGDIHGIYVEVLAEISKMTGLDIELYQISRDEYGYDLIADGTIDFIIGSSDTALEYNDNSSIIYTDSFMDYNTTAITRQNYQFIQDSAPRFALTYARQYWEQFIITNYPDASIQYYQSSKQCLEAIENKEADVTFLNTLEYNYQSKNPRFSGLIEWESVRYKSSTVMACKADTDSTLISIINKACNRIDGDMIQNITDYYLNIPYHSYNFKDHMYMIRIPLRIVCGFIFFTAIIIAIVLAIKRKNYKLLENTNKELLTANAAKTDFLSRMSHDMRTPMNGILGLTELMKDKDNINEIREDLEQVSNSGKYLLSLINDTLDMNKIEAGKLELHKEPINALDIYKIIINNAQMLTKDKGLNLELHTRSVDMDTEIPVWADVSRVQQVLMNLISNAVKYTPEGGTVAISIESVALSKEEIQDKYIVKDNGIGMNKEFVPHLFDAFSQEGRLGVDRQTGTGLGMSIVKQLVDLMGGTISVKSVENEGTEFCVTLNYEMYEGNLSTLNRNSGSTGILDGKRVLLCEDHPLNIKIATQLLQKKGVMVNVAENGQKGVEDFYNSPPGYYRAILMDIKMPVMDGITATKTIRKMKKEDAQTIPIIAMTANAYDSDVRDCLEAGMNAHIAKPISPGILYGTLGKWI